MRDRRWYRGYLFMASYIFFCAAFIAVMSGSLWMTGLVLAVGYYDWRMYKSFKHKWAVRRDVAEAFFAEAIAAVPEFAKREGNYMTLDSNGFHREIVWHDDCWVTKVSKP